MLAFERFEVLSFDCYGTLIDWRRGILDAVRPVLARHGIAAGEDQILQTYSRLEAEIEAGPYRPYRRILRGVMARMCGGFGFEPDDNERDIIASTLPDWPPFEDTVAALKSLKSRYRLAIISNTDNDLFAGTNTHLEVSFDHIITAAHVGAYKPDRRVFQFAFDKIGLPKEKILHVAQSLFHDHVPAKELGLTTIWINRRRALPGRVSSAARPDAEFPDLASLVKAIGL
jgi:2-haloacid dehalogenase